MPKVKSNVKAADNRLSRKDVGIGTKQAKKKAAPKDPNKPKRPPSAFFVFMSDFREEYKKENPNNKSVAVVGKAGGARWKSMSDAEKAPYHAKAQKNKLAYEDDIRAYHKGLSEGGDSDKSKSEVNDDDEDEEEEDE
ncbi:High mobility group [Stylosanthes scabra]|uniref:High mobility group n=1 Tax=Stylosanthes scabra TaxID=79078 RepID=A0ABU6ZDX6_9FABA|nr:High mobility group [Stylosanthes scabra]